ncbi:potassium channel family protein [Marinicella meishanensis]|uniref:potassium channel family protein n=1 Tax=Marinicella meishanensis TaxID=2873263 RepID=UPI001CBEE799|nr:potassium channel family protein [Marinicella sp. NBU2979]
MIVWATLINIFVVSLCVIIHYEFLFLLSKRINQMRLKPRFKIVFGVFGALLAHSIEVWIFAVAYYQKLKSGWFGHFQGNFDGSLLDCVYFSFTSFTTLGFGDIEPIGHIRFLTGIESLTGLVLITWSASFLFFEMQRYWKVK